MRPIGGLPEQTRGSGLGWRALALLLPLAGFSLPSAGAQNLPHLITSCVGTSETLLPRCQEAALGAQAAQGALGMAASGGTDLPGSASTLGWRMKGSPRFAISFRGALTRAPMPSFTEEGGLSRGHTTAYIPSLHLSGTLGLFDGFALGPTAGGFGSIDITGTTQWIAAPDDQGFQGNVVGWGIGARIGILRESFSLPGLSFSAFHRSLGHSELFDVDRGDPVEAAFALSVTSFRGVIGKDIGGIGFFGGAGWDRYTGATSLVVMDPGVEGSGSSASGGLRSGRGLLFAGGSLTFLAIQISVEAGVAEGFTPNLPNIPDSYGGGFDPSSRSEFGALAFRLTF